MINFFRSPRFDATSYYPFLPRGCLLHFTTMLPRSKRRPLTTDDLMRQQELGAHKRRKRSRDEDEESSPGSDGEDSQYGDSSALDEDEEAMSDIHPLEDNVPSRLSFKPRRTTVAKEDTTPSQPSSLPQTFVELGVSSSLVSAMNKMSIHTPTEIQIACIPPILDGMCFFFVFAFWHSVGHAEDFGKVGIV